MEWVFGLAGAAAGYWLFFKACDLAERRGFSRPEWLMHIVGLPLFLISICGGGFVGVIIEDMIFERGVVTRFIITWDGNKS